MSLCVILFFFFFKWQTFRHIFWRRACLLMWIHDYCAEKRVINSAVGLTNLAELNRLTSEQLVKQEGQQRGAESSPTPTQKGAPSSFSITLKRTDSLTSHLLHSYSEIPLPLYPRKRTHTHTNTHALCAPRLDISAHKLIHSSRWCVDVHTFERRGSDTNTAFIIFSFSFLTAGRSVWISVRQREREVAANTQHLWC